MNIQNSFEIENEIFYYYDLEKVFSLYESLRELPICLKILLEENLRKSNNDEEIEYIIDIFLNRKNLNINFYPSRIVMQNFSGISSLVDLASMRDILARYEGNINKVNPTAMIDIILDDSLDEDIEIKEKYKFIKWAKTKFENIRVIPPGSQICHQINLEYLSTIVHLEQKNGKNYLFPETIAGTNTETKIISSLGVLAYKTQGVKFESTIFGFPLSFNLPKVIGVEIKGRLDKTVTSSDLISNLTNSLKEYTLFEKIVEFYGDGIYELTLEDRLTISNVIYEYGAKSSFFPIDDRTLQYYDNTMDNSDFSKLIKEYLEKQSLFSKNEILAYDETIEINLDLIQAKIYESKKTNEKITINELKNFPVQYRGINLKDGDIVLAIISSNSNPYSLIHAGLIAKKACELGIRANDSIKKLLLITSSLEKIYLEKLDLLKYFERLGFILVENDYNFNDFNKNIEEDIKNSNLNVVSLSCGGEKFEESIPSFIKSSYIMSSSLIIVYTLAKTIKCNILHDCIERVEDREIKIDDIWPDNELVVEYLNKLDYSLYKEIYKSIFQGNEYWQKIEVEDTPTYNWDKDSTYIQASNFFDNENIEKIEIKNAASLVILGNNISSDNISPKGQIALYSSASNYLEERGIKSYNYNSFISREGNSEIMLRSIFDSVNLKNEMVSKEGGYTKDFEEDEIVSIYELSQRFKQRDRPLVIFAGKEFGVGESRDWAVKGMKSLGVKAIIAKSFDKVYREDLVTFGVLPLEFLEDEDSEVLNLRGDETIDIVLDDIEVNTLANLTISSNRAVIETKLKVRLDNEEEIIYYKNGGILSYLLKTMIS
ncbi:MAG: aconitate hydratase AcnA [Arcobacter sp.]|uniref:aconitate hydratase AcnA n=1 Tax=Arcobacter sp. TaxID=1872629 RepID=UPI003B006AAA